MKIYSSRMEVLSVIVTMFLLTVSGEDQQGNLKMQISLICVVTYDLNSFTDLKRYLRAVLKLWLAVHKIALL